MGDPIKRGKVYARPHKPWDSTRLEAEKRIKSAYGVKTKREIWTAEAQLRKKRHSARKMLAMTPENRKKMESELVGSLHRMGILKQGAMVDDILGLSTNDLLERRLQTMVVRKGLANTLKQARQFIVHGHIGVNGQKVTSPSYIVKQSDKLMYYGKPMVLKAPEPKETKKAFEEALPKDAESETEKEEEKLEEKFEEAKAEKGEN